MFTSRARRRRHSLDTYVRLEVEERTLRTGNPPIRLRPESPKTTSAGTEENQVTRANQSDRLSA